MTKKKLTVLVVVPDVVGRVNACAGLTSGLLTRGHRVVFFTESAMAGRMTAQGFEEFVYELDLGGKKEQTAKPGQKVALGMFENRIIGPYEPIEKMRNLLNLFLRSPTGKSRMFAQNAAIEKAIAEVKPDLIVVDNTYLAPAIAYSAIPWLHCISTSPQYAILDDSLTIPPGGSGFDSRNINPVEWAAFNDARRELFRSKQFSAYLSELGYEPYSQDRRIPDDAILTCYAWPEEIDFISSIRPDWINVETFRRDWSVLPPEKFLPRELLEHGDADSKWLYLSMGTMGCVDIDLMKRLIGMLSAVEGGRHRVLVSLGPREDELRPHLPRNAFGARYLPQTAVLPWIDLLVSHGGNNTVTEALARATPMLVMPLFADQYDNAQRLVECGLARRLDPYRCTQSEFDSAVSELLHDDALKRRLETIASRVRADDRIARLHDEIERRLCDE